MSSLLLKNVRAVDIGMDTVCDILIENSHIKKIDTNIEYEVGKVIDCTGLTAVPALFDMHVHLRDPGYTYKEDIITGTRSALAGGFTGVACMPNTNPPVDNVETVNYICTKSKNTGVKVYPVGCITVGMKGQKLCDYSLLKKAGIAAVSDDGRPVENSELMEQAMINAFNTGLPVISHCEDLAIINGGKINKGEISRMLGVPGMDRASEDSITQREILLAEKTNTRIHIAHVSTEGSVEIIRNAKARGVNVTCETAPHYFMMTDRKLITRDADYRMNPPLREESDRLAIIDGICDGTIDCIVTDHAPHSPEEKEDFLSAPNGIVGLETSLAATLTGLYHTGKLKLEDIVRLMSVKPREILGLKIEKLKEGARANITVVDTEYEWVVVPEKFRSKAKNTAFKGMALKGKPFITISNGEIKFKEI